MTDNAVEEQIALKALGEGVLPCQLSCTERHIISSHMSGLLAYVLASNCRAQDRWYKRCAIYHLMKTTRVPADWTPPPPPPPAPRRGWKGVRAEYRLSESYPDAIVRLGCDPEFTARWHPDHQPENQPAIVPAYQFISDPACYEQVGADGMRVELRPPAGIPERVICSIRYLLKYFCRKWPRLLLWADGDELACGGHIHISFYTFYNREFRLICLGLNDKDTIASALDSVLGWPSLRNSGKARKDFKVRMAWCTKSYGLEYITPPSAAFADPFTARAILELAGAIAHTIITTGVFRPAQFRPAAVLKSPELIRAWKSFVSGETLALARKEDLLQAWAITPYE